MKAKKAAKDKPLLKIGQAAKAAGVSRQTMEYYILIGLIVPIRSADKAARYFDEALVKSILGIPVGVRVIQLMALGVPVDPSPVWKQRLERSQIVRDERW